MIDRSSTRRVWRRSAPADIAGALLAWYDADRRDLPWRRLSNPYRTLVSEFMLQQTVVATVIPYFERFLARWPDVQALAVASEDDVIAMWSGLGYYTRARNLHRAAQAVVGLHDGIIPSDESALRQLPGVGPYTAAAVAAIAFGRRTFALDGNAARVVARLHGVDAPIDAPATRLRLRALGQDLVPGKRSGDFVQAIMELGATVCGPRAPACPRCPLRRFCDAYLSGQTARIPVKTARPPKVVVRLASVRVRRGGRLLLERRSAGLLARTWTFPSGVVSDEGDAQAVARATALGAGIVPTALVSAGLVRHLFTHRDVTVEVFDVTSFKSDPAAPEHQVETLWADEAGLDRLAMSSFARKQLALKRDKRPDRP